MKTTMLGFLAETPVHCGAGRSAGILDLPIAREAATDYPFIAGSGVKGALRDHALPVLSEGETEALFGSPDKAGDLMIGDARLLLLPVRSLSGAYRWATCPQVLERFQRDLRRCGRAADFALPRVAADPDGVAGAASRRREKGRLYLEEREFAVTGGIPEGLCELLGELILHRATRDRLADQLVILADDDFAWFCRYAVPIQARNVLDTETKRSKNLWYEESLPPDTLMYALVAARQAGSESFLATLFPAAAPYLQVGGNETVGAGILAVTRPEVGAA